MTGGILLSEQTREGKFLALPENCVYNSGDRERKKEKPMATELEYKYRLSPYQADMLLPPESARRIEMETTYYDTPGGELSRRRWTLRRRMENGRSVCALKTPLSGSARGEWEVLCGEIGQAIGMLTAAGAPEELEHLCGDGVEPVCGAAFTRLCWVENWQDAEVELAVDRGVLTGGGHTAPLSELEAELKKGAAADLERGCRELARRLSLVPEEKSKFRRAWELAKGV